MSFDFPITIQQDIQRYAQAEHISTDEAALKIVQLGLKAVRQRATLPGNSTKHKVEAGDLLTDELINQLKALDSSYGLLEDVPDEKIKRMEATIRRTKREGFPKRA